MITENKVSWAAGVIEGEGTFVFSKDKRSNYHKTAIQVEMTDRDCIQDLQATFGGSLWESNYPAKYKAFPNAKPSWRWSVHKQKEVFDTLLHIMPYLKSRRLEKARVLFDYLEPRVCK